MSCQKTASVRWILALCVVASISSVFFLPQRSISDEETAKHGKTLIVSDLNNAELTGSKDLEVSAEFIKGHIHWKMKNRSERSYSYMTLVYPLCGEPHVVSPIVLQGMIRDTEKIETIDNLQILFDDDLEQWGYRIDLFVGPMELMVENESQTQQGKGCGPWTLKESYVFSLQ